MTAPLLVTGGTGTIGSAIALRLRQDGHEVIATDTGPVSDGVPFLRASLPKDTDALVAALPAELGGIVHSIGMIETHEPLDWTDAMFDRLFQTNVLAPLRLVAALAERLKDGAPIVFVGSVAGLKPTPNNMLYGASKAALHHAAGTLASVLAPRGIRVNVVAPGLIDGALTEATNGALARLSGRRIADVADARVRAIPIGRIGDARDVAAAVSFLVSVDAGFVTGTVIPVTGGAHA